MLRFLWIQGLFLPRSVLGLCLLAGLTAPQLYAQRINGPDPGFRGGAPSGRGGIYSPGSPAPATGGYTFIAPQFQQQVIYGPPMGYGNPYVYGNPYHRHPQVPNYGPGYSSSYFWNSNAGYGAYGQYSGYGSTMIVPRSIVTQQVSPGVYLPVPDHNLAQAGVNSRPIDPLEQDLAKLNEDLSAGARFADPARRPIRISTLESKRAGIQARSDGDLHLLKQEWAAAFHDYDKAIMAADDDAENHYRRAITLAKLRQFDQAVNSMKRALHVDPELPKKAQGIPVLFGPENQLARLSLVQGVGRWVEEDIRDPNRLFLMGAILYFNDDPRSKEFFDAANRLGEHGTHIAAFLVQGARQTTARPNFDQLNGLPLSPNVVPLNGAPPAGGLAPAPPAPLPEKPGATAPQLPPLQSLPGQLVPKGPST